MLEAHLKTAPRPNDPRAFIFTMPNGSPVRHGNFYTRIFRPAVKKALTHEFRFHDLRHTCAAWLVEDGAHPLQIKLRLGHADIQTTMNIYGHLFPSAEDALADKLDARLTNPAPAKVVPLRRES